jgi:predicted glycogen debranching enzyme
MLSFSQAGFEDLGAKEWLVTNGLGGYASSSLSGANTRRYHGLLVAALQPPTGRTVMVSKIEETLAFQRDAMVGLSANSYPGVVHPQGFQYLESYEQSPLATFHYRVSENKLRKRIFMPQGSNTTIVEYLNTGDSCFKLSLNPLFVHRDYHSLFSEQAFYNYYINWKTPNTAVIYAHYGAQALHFSFSKGVFIENRSWFKNFEYAKEKYRGLDYREDSFSAGSVEVELKAGEHIWLAFSLDEQMVLADFQQLAGDEISRVEAIKKEFSDDDFFADLAVAADQFIAKRQSSGGETILAGYHWFTDWGRDTMIAMRGLCIALGKKELSESILRTFLKYLDGGMLPNRFPDQGEQPEYNTFDATLWLFVVLHEYYEKFGDLGFIRGVFPQLTQIIEAHIQGARYQIRATEEGLLYGGEGISNLTWMDARVGDYVVTPRHGCPVEINALWYNALMIYAQFAGLLGERAEQFEGLATKVKTAFRRYFLNEQGYLNDVVVPGESADYRFRANQIYALSLPFLLLNKKESRRVLQLVGEKLLTPLGLRTLDPAHPEFKPVYGGDQWRRDTAYHQGTVWPFLLGEYVLAHLRLNDFSKKSKTDALELLTPLRRHFYEEDCLHGISEIFDGGEPEAGRGCVQQAWSVGMLILTLSKVQQYV